MQVYSASEDEEGITNEVEDKDEEKAKVETKDLNLKCLCKSDFILYVNLYLFTITKDMTLN